MHETVFASSLLRIVLEEAKRHEKPGAGLAVTSIRLRTGLLACVEAHTLTGCFALLAEGTAAEGAALEVVTDPMQGHCPACNSAVTTQTRAFACPLCGNTTVQWEDGNKMYVDAINVVEKPAPQESPTT